MNKDFLTYFQTSKVFTFRQFEINSLKLQVDAVHHTKRTGPTSHKVL